MQIKIKCVCGSSYTFEDNPVNGRLQFPVNCINCGADGTEKAHAYIAAQLSGAPDLATPKKGMFSFLKKKDADADADVIVSDKTANAIPDPFDADGRRLGFATGGALVAGALGAFGWLMIAKATGYEIGYLAWGIGGLVGITARVLGPRGHHWLGIIGGAAGLIAIFGGQLLTANWAVNEAAEEFSAESYEEAKDWANTAVTATEEEGLREATATYKLATVTVSDKHGSALSIYQHYQLTESVFVLDHIIDRDQPMVVFAKQEEAEDVENVTEYELAHFKAKVLPELRALSAGKPSQQEYQSKMKQLIMSRMSFGSLVVAAMHPLSYVWVFLGVATAYRVAQKE